MEIYSRKCKGFWADISVDSTSDGTYSWCLRISPHAGDAPGMPVLDAAGYQRRDMALHEAMEALRLIDLAGGDGEEIRAPACRPEARVLH